MEFSFRLSYSNRLVCRIIVIYINGLFRIGARVDLVPRITVGQNFWSSESEAFDGVLYFGSFLCGPSPDSGSIFAGGPSYFFGGSADNWSIFRLLPSSMAKISFDCSIVVMTNHTSTSRHHMIMCGYSSLHYLLIAISSLLVWFFWWTVSSTESLSASPTWDRYRSGTFIDTGLFPGRSRHRLKSPRYGAGLLSVLLIVSHLPR